ncbi:concanavalin A-like lectin/glucanase, partial [Meira miltonrushii]
KGTYSAKGDSAGKYEFTWQGIDDAIVGKGFKNGAKDRVFTFDGQFEVSGNGAYLALYGWSVGSKCVEYYVVDNWGQYPPCGSDSKGTLQSDGDTYTFCTVMGGPCVDNSSQNHIQYWSRRHTKRSKGTITFANHVSAWEKAGMVLGTLSSPQILAVEAYAGSSGSATITI